MPPAERATTVRRNEVTIDPADAGPGVTITSPPDGHRLDQDDPPVVIVTGRVKDPAVTALSVLANDRRLTARVIGGQFRLAVPMMEAVVRVTAELPARDGMPSRSSRSVVVHASGPRPAMALMALDWPDDASDVKVDVVASWRAEPSRLDAPSRPVALSELNPEGKLPRLLYLRNIKPGAYTFVLRSAVTGAPVTGRATLYFSSGTRLTERPLKPFAFDGGQTIVARVLFPQGVLWEQTDWFSGQSESADSITKFRFPDGISWIEKKQ